MSAKPFDLPAEQLTQLKAAYASPPRAYHNFGHVKEVLRHYQLVENGPGWVRPTEVQLAVLYHDAIYEPGRADNEARSAEFAREQIVRWRPNENIDVARVMQLIELTARHGSLTRNDVDPEAALFLDCDMAILAAAPAAFDAYNQGIADEYRSVVSKTVFDQKRKQFLDALLQRERIYLSEFFHQRLDRAARANLRGVTGSCTPS